MSEPATTLPVALEEAAYERYLSYALSVITSRALPDVRDGLKPVQRRILYTMDHELGLAPSGRYRKSAAVVGEVMGKYHPHGDSSIYEALVRMAQSFSLRAPLVDGQGNFGSLDGDPPAAMRYTECRLTPIAIEMLSELGKDTVDHRPSYDGQRSEPVVLPARFPQLLVNGCEGIAVGMATRIPPHALAEVVEATELLLADPETSLERILEVLPGPDFPTGGRIVTPREDLAKIYAEGHGSFRLRATWETEKEGRRRAVIVTAIPYGTNKSKLVERIGGLVADRKLPLVVDVRDESTDDVRIVLELRADAAPEPVMAFLFRHTDLEVSYGVNLTVLVPSGRADVAVPERIDVRRALLAWLEFRDATVRRRLSFDLAELLARIHILEGYAIVIDALDEAIRIIRASEGRRDAAEKLIRKFKLSDEQADAILELRLYRLAKMELTAILEDLEDQRARAAELTRILASTDEIRKLIRHELRELVRLYADPRRTQFGVETLSYDEDAYIVKEDAWVVTTRDGWIKRQATFTALDKIRVRDGDQLGWLSRANTRSIVTLFGDQGSAYAVRVDDLPATTGHGEPVQRQFSLADGERIVGLASHDERVRPPVEAPPEPDDPPGPYAVALTRRGRVLRFALDAHDEPSTKNGRRYLRLDEGDRVFAVWPAPQGTRLAIATRQGRAVVFPTSEIPVLKATKRCAVAIELKPDDEVFAADLAPDTNGGVVVHATNGETYPVNAAAYPKGTIGTPGKMLFRRSAELDAWLDRRPIVLGAVDADADRANGGVT